MNKTARKPKITMPCIVNSAEENPNPLIIVWLTEVTFISDDILISVLNTCQTYAALTEWRNYVLRNIDRVAKISRIDENDLNKFCEKLESLIDNRSIRPTAPLNCKTLDINAIGYGDGDDIAVNKDPKNNLLINFGKSVQFNPEEEEYKKKWSNLPRNGDLITLINNGSSSGQRHAIASEINIAKNMHTYLSQCDKKYTEDDIDCLTLDLLDKYISVENKKFKLNIYDGEGKLNSNGEVVLNVLHKKFPHVTRNRIKFRLEDNVKKSLSNFTFFDDLENEKDDFIFEMKDAVAHTLNQEKYFSPELYEEIKITHGVIDGTFFTLHYFQCIFYGLMMYYRDADPQIRKSIIMKSFDIIEIFEKPPEEFANSKFVKINNISKPEELLDFFIKSIYSESILKKDCDEIKTIIKQLYSTAYSEEAKKSVRDRFHATQINLLFPDGKKLFINKDGKVGVGFPTICELVMGKKLSLPPELIASYQNLPDEVKLYEYELTIADISPEELQNWSAEQIIAKIDVLSKKQLNGLSAKRLECLTYLKDPNNNFSESDKQKVFQRFVESDKSFIKSFSAKEFIDWNEYIDIDVFGNILKNEVFLALVDHLKENDDLSINFIKKIFCLLENKFSELKPECLAPRRNQYGARTYRDEIINVFNDELFVKLVQYQDYVDFAKMFKFHPASEDIGLSIALNNCADSKVLDRFCQFLYANRYDEQSLKLLSNPYFSRLVFQCFLDIPIAEVVDFYGQWSGSGRLAQFPSKRVDDLISFLNDTNQEMQKRNLALEIFMKKIKRCPELIEKVDINFILINISSIESDVLFYLSKEKFQNLIDKFHEQEAQNFEKLQIIYETLLKKWYSTNTIKLEEIFNFILRFGIDKDSEKQSHLKKYFINLLDYNFNIDEKYNEFCKYMVTKFLEDNKWTLNVFPPILNYFPIEQMYDNFHNFEKLGLNEKFFFKFNELINYICENGKIKFENLENDIIRKMLKNSSYSINNVNNNEMLINLMLKNENEIDEELLNVVAKNINGTRFSQLIRWGKNNYSIAEMPENVKLIFFNFISKIDYAKLEFYNFDFESRVFMLNFYLNCIKNRDERFQNMSKKLLLKSTDEYLLKTINYVKNNSEENNFVNDLKEVIFSEFANLPVEAMLKLSDLNMYKDKFFSIYSNNVSDEFLNGLIYQNLFMDYIDKINDMLKNENFKTKLEDYINNDLNIRNYELLELYKSKNKSIINLISKERFIKFAEESWSFLSIVAKYTNKYFDDISDNILKKFFNDEEIYVIRAVSDEKFGEIFVQLRMECKEDEIETMQKILLKKYRPFITKGYLTEEEITNLSFKDNQEDILNALKKLNQKIKIKEESKTTGVEKRREEEEKKRREEEEKKQREEEEKKQREEEEKKQREEEEKKQREEEEKKQREEEEKKQREEEEKKQREEEEKKQREEEEKKQREEEEKKRREEEEKKQREEEEKKRREEEERKRREEDKSDVKIEGKNETVAMKNENTEEKPSHKKRNVAFIIAGIVAVSVSIMLLPLALLSFLSFGIGLGIAVGLFVIGTGSTGFGSKSFDNEKIAELMERDPETYTKFEKVLYNWRDPIKEHIEKFAQTDKPGLENNSSQNR